MYELFCIFSLKQLVTIIKNLFYTLINVSTYIIIIIHVW